VGQDEEEGEGSGAGQAANSTTSPSGGQQARKSSISFSLPFGSKAKK
jgi:hypothetical protein